MFSAACGDCNLYYRTNISGSDLIKINTKIQKKDPLFNAVNGRVLVVTWYRTKAFYVNDVNTYQAIIASDGSKTYTIISYHYMTFYTSPTTPAVRLARVGFKVNNNKVCSFPGSRTNDLMNLKCRSNAYVPGLFVIGLTPDADFQCNAADILPFDCSHCTGEQTWVTTACPTGYSPACGSNGVTYTNQCMHDRERCRMGDNITLAYMGECSTTLPPTSMAVESTSVNQAVQPSATTGTSSSMNVHPTMSMRVSPSVEVSPSPPLTSVPSMRSSSIKMSVKPSLQATLSSTVYPRTSIRPPVPDAFSCDFERDACGFEGAGPSGPWIRRRGSTPTNGTGPDVDGSGNYNGYYVHFEATGRNRSQFHFPLKRQVASNGNHAGCLRFSYHMYGTDINYLYVAISGNSSARHILLIMGNQGNRWFTQQVSFNNIYFEIEELLFGVLPGGGDKGDIAIDNIRLTFGDECQTPHATTITGTLLYPYGREYGDRTLPSGDDTYHSYYIPTMLLFSKKQNVIYISINGAISVGRPGYGSIPNTATFLSLYATDLDTRNGGGTIYYRDTRDYRVLTRANTDVQRLHPYSNFTSNRALVISYIHVVLIEARQHYDIRFKL